VGCVGSKRTAEKTKAPASKPKLQTFDPSLTILPANYSGTSIMAAFATFRVIPKGEFETSEESEKRLKNLPVGTYACGALSIHRGDLRCRFRERFAPTAIHPGDGYSRTEYAGVELSREKKRTRRYVGANAFGASVQIEEYAYDCLSLITDLHDFRTLSVNVDRAAAPQTKQIYEYS
jgi:hypothetical protein